MPRRPRLARLDPGDPGVRSSRRRADDPYVRRREGQSPTSDAGGDPAGIRGRWHRVPAGRRGATARAAGRGGDVVKDALVIHRRLVAGGLSAEQARTLLRLLAEAEAGRFDRRTVAEEIAAAGYGPAQTEAAIAELLQAIARQAGRVS